MRKNGNIERRMGEGGREGGRRERGGEERKEVKLRKGKGKNGLG